MQIGFNPSSPNTGFFPGVGYRSGIPSLPVIDVEPPVEGSKLIEWCYWITYRRFYFLLYLESMLQDLMGDGPDRHPLEMWEMITASFKRPAEAEDCPSLYIEIPGKGNSNLSIAYFFNYILLLLNYLRAMTLAFKVAPDRTARYRTRRFHTKMMKIFTMRMKSYRIVRRDNRHGDSNRRKIKTQGMRTKRLEEA